MVTKVFILKRPFSAPMLVHVVAGQQNNNVENSFDGERMVVEVLNPA
jgi:hypothetical protein